MLLLNSAAPLPSPRSMAPGPSLSTGAGGAEALDRGANAARAQTHERAGPSSTPAPAAAGGRKQARGKSASAAAAADAAAAVAPVPKPPADAATWSVKGNSVAALMATGDTRVLSKSEEAALVQVVKEYMAMDAYKARLARTIGRAPTHTELARTTRTGEGALAELLRLGMHAKSVLVHCNLRLVVSIARRYEGQGLPLSDLVEEGVQGLVHSLSRFDPSKGYKLSTYATWWIRQRIGTALRKQGGLITVPANVWEDIMKKRGTAARLAREQGVVRVKEEALKAELGWSDARWARIASCARMLESGFSSLEATVSPDGEGGSLSDILESGTGTDDHEATHGDAGRGGFTLDAEAFSEDVLLSREFARSLAQLGPHQEAVMRLRLGVRGEAGCGADGWGASPGGVSPGPASPGVSPLPTANVGMSFAEVGSELNMTMEQVRALSMKAMRRLKGDAQLRNTLSESGRLVVGGGREREPPGRGGGGAALKMQTR
ncbi:hypothetical protein FOA52_013922 [Chlamydomonas sp. UWO 241]|nr:hypothetical protein FOA52_013922 [Chlamydomonas sp. UWO 241]